MADNNRDLTGVPLNDLSAEEAAVASEQMMAKISELISELQKNEMKRGSLMKEYGDIHLASGFKGWLAQMMNQKGLEKTIEKREDIGMSLKEAKKAQAELLRKSIIDFRSSSTDETEDDAKARYADLELKALKSIGNLYREGLIDREEYGRRFNEIDEQSNKVYGGGAQNLDASVAYTQERKDQQQDEAVNSVFQNRMHEMGSLFGEKIANSKFSRAVTGFAKTSYPFFKANRVNLGKIFNGKSGSAGAQTAVQGLSGLTGNPVAKALLFGAEKMITWTGEYAADRRLLRQQGVAGGFGEGALATEKAAYYRDLGDSLNKGGGQALITAATNINMTLARMRRGGDGGPLAGANAKYGLVLNGSGEGGLAKDADEIFRNVISTATRLKREGRTQEVAAMLSEVGISPQIMELFTHGQEAFNARVRNKTKMLSADRAAELDKHAIEIYETDADADRTRRNRNEAKLNYDTAGLTENYNLLTRIGNRFLGTSEREKTAEGLFSRTSTAAQMIESDKGNQPLPVPPGGASPQVMPETIGGGSNVTSNQNNSLDVHVDKVELHTTATTLEGVGQDVGAGIKDGLESWSKPLVKNFGDAEL